MAKDEKKKTLENEHKQKTIIKTKTEEEKRKVKQFQKIISMEVNFRRSFIRKMGNGYVVVEVMLLYR